MNNSNRETPLHHHYEDISAMVDGEITRKKSALIIKNIDAQEGLQAWGRYHLIGEVMRKGLPRIVADEDFATRFEKVLEKEPTVKINKLQQFLNKIKAFFLKK